MCYNSCSFFKFNPMTGDDSCSLPKDDLCPDEEDEMEEDYEEEQEEG